MAFKVSYTKNFGRDAKAFKNNKPLKAIIPDILSQIIENPLAGEPLLGNMDGLYKYCFGERPQMRILYVVYDCCNSQNEDKSNCKVWEDEPPHNPEEACKGIIDFIFFRTREACNNLYAKDKRYFKQFLRQLE